MTAPTPRVLALREAIRGRLGHLLRAEAVREVADRVAEVPCASLADQLRDAYDAVPPDLSDLDTELAGAMVAGYNNGQRAGILTAMRIVGIDR